MTLVVPSAWGYDIVIGVFGFLKRLFGRRKSKRAIAAAEDRKQLIDPLARKGQGLPTAPNVPTPKPPAV